MDTGLLDPLVEHGQRTAPCFEALKHRALGLGPLDALVDVRSVISCLICRTFDSGGVTIGAIVTPP